MDKDRMASVKCEAAGYKNSSYTVTATREYPHLSTNDLSLIPKTITDNGKTLTLDDVSWEVQRYTNIDYYDIPESYRAVAVYTAKAFKSVVTGYITTAEYTGEITKTVTGDTVYIAYFEGSEINPAPMPTPEPTPTPATPSTVTPPEQPVPVTQSGSFPYMPLLIGFVAVVAFVAGAGAYWLFLRHNVKVSRVKDGRRALVAKDRISGKNLTIDLSPLEYTCFDIEIDKYAAKTLNGRTLTVRHGKAEPDAPEPEQMGVAKEHTRPLADSGPEWFVKHGIEVWSVNEGEQKIEQHVDKLMNYIRFWQAAGESEKTSIRTKTRLGQIVQEGCFRGGGVPYGYRLEKQGRMNKGNYEVNEILIDEGEAAVVRLIFDLYVTKGYGSHRIATYLLEQGVLNRKGTNFANVTIHHMLGNRSYMGILKSGETESNIFPHLQIIDPHTFETVQNLRLQRSAAFNERRVPLNTKGSSLLSGNIFCGHCGARLTVTTNGKKRQRKDGEVTVTPRTRYVCYNKTRHAHLCDGQTGYTVRKLDAVVETVVHSLFEQLNDVPKDAVIAERYASQIAEYQTQLVAAKATLQANTAEVMEYEREVIKVIRGESKLNPDLLNKLHEEAKEKAAQSEQAVKKLESKIQDGEQMRDSLSRQFDTLRTWADMYDGCDMETKKMILSRIMKSVRVSRDYEIEIDFTVDFEQIGGVAHLGADQPFEMDFTALDKAVSF